ncbi:MAG: UDP-3-O-acyl-N-acetylglucosamine deacetylase [Planctomycetaceae bacterium]
MFRNQRTIERPVEIRGIGLFGSTDAKVRLLPAPECHGIAFLRTDLADRIRIPALIRYVISRGRRTAIGRHGAVVEVIEHLMAALAGLQVDNCLIEIDGPEPPSVDGSALPFVEAIDQAGIAEQSVSRRVCVIQERECLFAPSGRGRIEMGASAPGTLHISYDLDYDAPAIGRQSAETIVTPETFTREIAFARTFVLESEVVLLQAAGLGTKATTESLLVFGDNGPINNQLRADAECARHKILDCIGDFALLGCDLQGSFQCVQSGHALNHDLVRHLDKQLRLAERVPAAG